MAKQRTLALLTVLALAAGPLRAAEPPAPPLPAAAAAGAVPETVAGADGAPGDASRRPLRVAVYDLDAVGVDERTARIFVDSLLAELRKLQRCSVVSLDEVRTLLDLEAQKQLMGCDEGSCLAEIADALGADVLVVGGFANVSGKTSLALKRIDAKQAEVVANYTQQLEAAGGEELLAAVGPAVDKLFSDVPLRAGETRGVPAEIALRLNPPPVPVWGFATAASATGLGVVATTATGLWWAASDGALQSTFEAARTTPTSALIVKEQQEQVRASNTAFWAVAGVTTAFAIATGVLAPFTDWKGHGEEQ